MTDHAAARARAADVAYPDIHRGGEWRAPLRTVLAALTPTQAWRDRAACKNHGPDLFHPAKCDRGGRVAKAKAICATCPVTAECLAVALNVGPRSDHGIYGGTTPLERVAIRRQQAGAA